MEKQSILKIFVSKTNRDLQEMASLPNVILVNTIEEADVVAIGGGGDINPLIYCSSYRIYQGTTFKYSEARDLEEIEIYAKARKLHKPIFAIKRGAILVTALKGFQICQHSRIPNIASHVKYSGACDFKRIVECPIRVPIIPFHDSHVIVIATSEISKNHEMRRDSDNLYRGENLTLGIPHAFYFTHENILCNIDSFDRNTFISVFRNYLEDMIKGNIEAIYERADVKMPIIEEEDDYFGEDVVDDEEDVVETPLTNQSFTTNLDPFAISGLSTLS